MHQEFTYPMLPMEIAAVRNGVAPIPSAERLMLTVLHLDEKRAELEKANALLADGLLSAWSRPVQRI
jgi:hypothetical protein